MALLARATSKNPADWTDRELLQACSAQRRPWLGRAGPPLSPAHLSLHHQGDAEVRADARQRGPRRDLRRRHDAARARRHAQAPHLQPGARHEARLVDRHDLGQRRLRLPAQRRSPPAARQGRRRARSARGVRPHAARSADREGALGSPQRPALRLHGQGPHVRRALLPEGPGGRRDRGRDADQPQDGLLEEAQDSRAPRALPQRRSPATRRSPISRWPSSALELARTTTHRRSLAVVLLGLRDDVERLQPSTDAASRPPALAASDRQLGTARRSGDSSRAR